MLIPDSGFRILNRLCGVFLDIARIRIPRVNNKPSPRTVTFRIIRTTGDISMSTITTRDGVEIFYKDWGSGQPIVFSHGWPLSADDWDAERRPRPCWEQHIWQVC